ncbi:MAG: hypothetical protein FWD16_03925 [Clostridia bacterium]|nr:hypothetical protein [Clostridia bacterium]
MKSFWHRVIIITAIVGLLVFGVLVFRQQQRIAQLRTEYGQLLVQLEEATYQARLQALVAEHAGSELDKTRVARSRLGWVPDDVILFYANQTEPAPTPGNQPGPT